MEQKKDSKISMYNIIKVVNAAAKDDFKRAVGMYVNLMLCRGEYYRNREHLLDSILDAVNEMLDMIDFSQESDSCVKKK